MMDLSFLNGLMGGDKKLVDRFITIFKTQVPDQVAALSQLCDNQDWEELSTALHSLKTQFSYVGLPEFAEQMRAMEEQVDHGETARMASQIADFTKTFNLFWQAECAAS